MSLRESQETSLMEHEGAQDVHGNEIPEGKRRDKSRKCTDVLCLLVFFAYLGWMGYTYHYATQNGNIHKLTHGYDWTGQICSVGPDVKTKPYLYWCATQVTLTPEDALAGKTPTMKISDGICVESCPNSNQTTHLCPSSPHVRREKSAPGADGSQVIQDIVQRDIVKTQDQVTMPVLGMYCLPTHSKELVKQILDHSGTGSYAQQVLTAVHGIAKAKKFLGVVTFLAIVAGYVFLLCLKICVKPLVYTFLFTVWIGLLGAGGGSIGSAYAPEGSNYNVYENYFEKDTAYKAAIGSGAVFLILWAIYSCIAWHAHTAIGVTMQSIKESCDVIVALPTLLLQPLITILLKLSAFAALLYGLFWIMSLGEVTTTSPLQTKSGLSISGMHRSMQFTDWQKYWIAIFVFGIVWVLETITALSQFAICHAVVKYSLFQKKECLPLARGFFNGLVFHLGTLAFGGFIIGALKIITAICAYVSKQATNPDGSQNKVVKVLCCCIICCLMCLTHIVELLNEMVYVDVSIRGTSYVSAAKNVVKMLVANPVTFATVHGATSFVRFLGIAVIGGGGTYLTYLYLEHPFSLSAEDEALVASPMLDSSTRIGTTVAAGFICFAVSHAFMVIFDNCADALMYCILWKKSKNIDVDHPESWKMAGAHKEKGDYQKMDN